MVQNLKKVLKSKISKFFSFLRHEVPFKAKNNREAVVVCAIHVVKRPSKRSVLVFNILKRTIHIELPLPVINLPGTGIWTVDEYLNINKYYISLNLHRSIQHLYFLFPYNGEYTLSGQKYFNTLSL